MPPVEASPYRKSPNPATSNFRHNLYLEASVAEVRESYLMDPILILNEVPHRGFRRLNHGSFLITVAGPIGANGLM